MTILQNLDEYDDSAIWVQTLVNLFAIIAFILTFQTFRDRQTKIIKECDAEQTTPSDYAIRVCGLHDLLYTEQDT